MSSVDYILENFMPIEQIALLSNLAEEQLHAMIAARCLPGPAYEVTGIYRIQSVFGEHEEQKVRAYYPASHVARARTLARSNIPYELLATELEQAFLSHYVSALEGMKANEFGLAHLFDKHGRVGGKGAEQFLAEEFQHYLTGTYGLCTRNNTVEEIATKEIMIAKIKHLTQQFEQGSCAELPERLAEAVEALDKVSAPFAPHERERSSRGAYIDEVRAKYLKE